MSVVDVGESLRLRVVGERARWEGSVLARLWAGAGVCEGLGHPSPVPRGDFEDRLVAEVERRVGVGQ